MGAFNIITGIKDKVFSFFVLATTGLLLISILIMPEYFKNSAAAAVDACLTSVIPSLFCFIVLTKIVVSSGFAYLISKPFGKLFSSKVGS